MSRTDRTAAPAAAEQPLAQQVDRLTALVEEQARAIDDLQRRLGATVMPSTERSAATAARTTTRRGLVTKGAVAASAALGGALLLGTQPAAAAQGDFDGNPAVRGTSNDVGGTGVLGVSTAVTGENYGVSGEAESPDGIAVGGINTATTGFAKGVGGASLSPSGWGVFGTNVAQSGDGARGIMGHVSSPTGTAIEAFALAATGASRGIRGVSNSPEGVGLVGTSPGTGVAAESERTQLRFDGTPPSPLESPTERLAGEVVFDEDDDLWVCVVSGTPGTWRRISGPASAGTLVVLPTPIRVYDSRPGGRPDSVGPKTPLVAGTPRTLDLTVNGSGVPTGATAAVVNLVATGSAAAGFLAIYRNGIANPGTSNVNFGAGESVAVTTLTALDDLARCAVRANVDTDVVVDVFGYHR